MGKLVVVENDKVEGTDKHNVKGDAINPNPPPDKIPETCWVAEYDYSGKMTDQLSDFVRVDGKAVALKNSKSSLNPGEDASPSGKHSGPMGKNFAPPPPSPVPDLTSLSITDPVGEGNPSASSGSSFVKVDGVEVLLDGDSIDTCDGTGALENSTVTAENQDFVSCSE